MSNISLHIVGQTQVASDHDLRLNFVKIMCPALDNTTRTVTKNLSGSANLTFVFKRKETWNQKLKDATNMLHINFGTHQHQLGVLLTT